jgi:broad specificity phosphatase PhoE
MSTTVLLIRHGECQFINQRLNGRLPGVTLTPTGQQQSQKLVYQLCKTPINAIYSSPMERAIETAKPLAEYFKKEIEHLHEFNEIDFGQWTGISFEELNQKNEWHIFNSKRSSITIPGGESFQQLQNRIQKGFEYIKKKHHGECICVFTHADVIRAALVQILGMSLDHILRLETAPGSISTVRLNDGTSWVVNGIQYAGNI